MTLSGLLDLVAAQPELAEALGQEVTGADLIAPAALRPFGVAALARTRPVLAVTATGREAEDLAAALTGLLPESQVAVFPAWETLPHERLSPRSARWASGSPSCGGSPIRSRATRARGRCGWWSPRSARSCSPSWRASGIWSRYGCVPATTPTSKTWWPGWWRTATTGSTWWRSAARSRSGAACSTCSRRPRNTRCGWSSGATPWRRSAGSRSPTSARSKSPRAGCSPRRAVSCCSPPRSATGPGSWPRTTRRWARSSARWPTGSRSRAWRRSRRCSPGTWTC